MASFRAAVAVVALALCAASAAVAGDMVFTAQEIAVIKAYYGGRDSDRPRTDGDSARRDSDGGAVHGHGGGQAEQGKGRGRNRERGRGGLPPGIAMNLARGKPLPPGIAMQTLPPDLSGRLPPPAPGCERIIVDGKVLLVDVATHIVHDILADAVYR